MKMKLGYHKIEVYNSDKILLKREGFYQKIICCVKEKYGLRVI